MFYISIGVTIYMIGLMFLSLFRPRDLLYLLCQEVLIIFINYVLIWSVSSIRGTIKAIEEKFPNDTLMVIHLGNFIVYTIFFLVSSSFYAVCSMKQDTKDVDLEDFGITACKYAYFANFF